MCSLAVACMLLLVTCHPVLTSRQAHMRDNPLLHAAFEFQPQLDAGHAEPLSGRERVDARVISARSARNRTRSRAFDRQSKMLVMSSDDA